MVICRRNILILDDLREVIHENDYEEVMRAVLDNTEEFFYMISDYLDTLCAEYDPSDWSPNLNIFKQMLQNKDEAWYDYLQTNQANICKIIISILPEMEVAYNEMLEQHYCQESLGLCVVACFLCKKVGLTFKQDILSGLIPKAKEEKKEWTEANSVKDGEPDTATANEQYAEEKVKGFLLKNGFLYYNGSVVRKCKTVAAGKDSWAYVAEDGIHVSHEDGQGRLISRNDVAEIAVETDCGLVYLTAPYSDGQKNIIALTNEDYPDAAAVAVSVRGYQYAVLLNNGKVKSNVPVKRGTLNGEFKIIDVNVSRNVIFGITEDYRVISGCDGMLDYQNVKKVVSHENTLAVLTRDGEVFYGESKKSIVTDAVDIDICAKGIVIMGEDYISLVSWSGKCSMLIEGGAVEMAVSDNYLICRKRSQLIERIDL